MVLRILSTGQVLLYTLSWCSACSSVSEGVFLKYLWREMYSMSTYSSAIQFFLLFFIELWLTYNVTLVLGVQHNDLIFYRKL